MNSIKPKDPVNEIEIKVKGYKLIIQKATHRMSISRAALSMEAEKLWTGKSLDNLEQQLLHYDHSILYPSLAACTAGKHIPDYEEFVGLTEDYVKLWIDAAYELNPSWFPGETPVGNTPEELQKKEEKLIPSTLDLATVP